MRLVITSATLDGEKFSTYFRDCPVFSIPGRCYEVAVVHAAQVTSAHTRTHVAASFPILIHGVTRCRWPPLCQQHHLPCDQWLRAPSHAMLPMA